MGVKGLWKLLDGTGRHVNLESLEGKILAVDISVWLNMAIKGMRDYHGHSSQTAHLTTLFNRICKLLYYGIKPVFVFDGQAPALKQRTLRERRERKDFNHRESRKASEKILQNYLKKQILQETVGKKKPKDVPSSSKTSDEKETELKPSQVKPQEKDIYDLPPLASQLEDSDQEELEDELKMRTELQTEYLDDAGRVDIAGILNMNIDSKDFNSFPSDVQYELLKDLKEIRKRRRTKLEMMPEESNDFSDYQLAGLLAKRKITKKMEYVENKMSEENVAASSHLSGLGEDLMKDHVVDARQLVSDSTSHYIWMRKLDGKNGQDDNAEEGQKMPGRVPLALIEEETEGDSSPQKKASVPTSASEEVGTGRIVSHPISDELDLSTKGESRAELPFQTQKTQKFVANVDLGKGEPVSVQNAKPSLTASMPFKENHEILKPQTSDADAGTETSSDLLKNRTENDTDEIVDTVTCDLGTDADGHANLHPKNYVKEGISGQNVSIDRNGSHTSENRVQISTAEKASVIEILDEESRESSGEDFLDVPEQDYSSVTIKETTPPKDTVSDCQDVEPPVKNSDEEYGDVGVNPWEGLDVENVENFASQLDEESRELRKMMQAKERAAKDLSQSAQLECQELLKLFGLPYIISPQEAEAQCATLELLGLTQGTITEDSDIWLFGGKYVIKDMFGNKNDPVAFNVSDIEMQLGLNRDRFICIALCSGSDYTTGIRGIGPVTAMEIMREFEGEGIQGLVKLKNWWDQVCSSAKQALPTETKIKSQLRKINLRKDFPSQAVYKAYLQPVVDDEKKKFEWGYPDLDELRHFATGTMSWTRQKVDEVLLPLMKKLGQQRSSQSKVTQFFSPMPRTSNKKRSKRVMRSAAVLTGNSKSEEGGELEKKKPRRNARSKKVQPKKEEKLNLSESSSDED